MASAVPSPPSAIGTISISASGSTSRSPVAMFSATPRALSAPLNLSGAIRVRILKTKERRFPLRRLFRRRLGSRRSFNFALQDFPRELRVGFAFGQFHYLTLEEIQRRNVACFKVCHRLWICRNHFVTDCFNRAQIAQLLDPFFFHDLGGVFSTRKHLSENFPALLAADFSAVDQIHQLIQRLRRNWTIMDAFISSAEGVLQIV